MIHACSRSHPWFLGASPSYNQMPPFQPEGFERPALRRSCHTPQAKPFGVEGEEAPPKPKKLRRSNAPVKKPFAEEPPEAEEEHSTSDVEIQSTPSFFALGWETLTAYNKATAWKAKEKEDELQMKASKKRAYDNTKRKAAATAKPSEDGPGTFARNGASPQRIQNLLAQDCQCASVFNSTSGCFNFYS